jgi:hypothetical protein
MVYQSAGWMNTLSYLARILTVAGAFVKDWLSYAVYHSVVG